MLSSFFKDPCLCSNDSVFLLYSCQYRFDLVLVCWHDLACGLTLVDYDCMSEWESLTVKYQNVLVSRKHYGNAGCLQSLLCLDVFIITLALKISCKHLEMPRATALWEEKKKGKKLGRQCRHFHGVQGVFQRRTKNNLWHPSLIQPAAFFSPASFLPCSLFAVDT